MKKKFKTINLLLICIILTATVLNPIVFATKINFQVNEPNLNDDSISRDIIIFAEHNFKNQINDFILNSNFYEVTVTNKYDVHLATPMRVYDYNIDNMTLNSTEIYYFPVLEKNELIGTYAVAKLENGILSGTLSKSFADKFNYLSKNNYKPGVHKLIRIKSALFLSNNSSKVINELESDTPSNLDIDKYKEDIDKKIETLLDKSSVEEYSFESIIINSNLIFSDPGAPVDYKYLSVPIVLQNGMNWCWAVTCADIAYAFIQYYLYTDDELFMAEKGFEVILETARLWMDLGDYHNGTFQIHTVTGPDEYTALVNNNYYTNAMAKYHLEWTYKMYKLLDSSKHESVKHLFEDLVNRLNINYAELRAMKTASEKMFFLYDETHKMYAQDDTFLTKPMWPVNEEAFSHRPLLLNYHPLTIYRHQILKQADTLLAHMLLEQYVTEDDIKNAFNYYEPITTHDSSLSTCIYGIMASRCGFNDKAFEYFSESLMLDLKDTHKNTKDGLHMANMAGSILSVTAGFAGLRICQDCIILRPQKPTSWDEFSFKLNYQGRLLKVTIGDETKLELLEGEGIYVKIWDRMHYVETVKPPVKAVVFDLDGVLTETSKAHFEAWKMLASELGFEVPDELEDKVRGISRLDSLEIVLTYGNLNEVYTDEEKVDLANHKNDLYLDLIKGYTPENLSLGAVSLLTELREKGIKIALASASKNAPFLLEAMGITAYFDVVVDPASIENGKPEPDIFLKASELLGITPGYCIGVEDAYAGIESIKAAGMTPMGIGSKTVLSNCDTVFSGLESFHNFLLDHSIIK